MTDKMDLNTYSADELSTLLVSANSPLRKAGNAYSQRKMVIDEARHKRNAHDFVTRGMLKYIFGAVGIITWIIVSYITKNGSIGFTAGLILGLICLILFSNSRKKNNIDIASISREEDAKYNQIIKEAYQEMPKDFIELIPQKYWSIHAIWTMYELLKDQRASNWKELVNLYETLEHQKRLEEQSQIQTQMTKQALENSQKAVNLAGQAADNAAIAADIAFISGM